VELFSIPTRPSDLSKVQKDLVIHNDFFFLKDLEFGRTLKNSEASGVVGILQ